MPTKSNNKPAAAPSRPNNLRGILGRMPTPSAPQQQTAPAAPTMPAPAPVATAAGRFDKKNTHIHLCIDPGCKFIGTHQGTQNTYDLYSCKGNNLMYSSPVDPGVRGSPGYVAQWTDRKAAYMSVEGVQALVDGKHKGFAGSNKLGDSLNKVFIRLHTKGGGNNKTAKIRRVLKLGEICPDCKKEYKARVLFLSHYIGCGC